MQQKFIECLNIQSYFARQQHGRPHERNLDMPLEVSISFSNIINNKQEIKLVHISTNWVDISLNKIYSCG